MKWIRPWVLEDSGAVAEGLNNIKVQQNLRDGIPFPYTEADGREYITSTLAAPVDSQYTWAIQMDGRAVGSIGVFRKDNIHSRTAELGYWLAEPCWGKGIVTAAVREVCQYVFDHTDIIRIFAEPFAYNAASCRVLEKAGFVYEGTLRSNAVKNGQVIDMKMYALVRDAEDA